MNKNFVITLICVLLLFSCKKEDSTIVSGNELSLSDDGYLKFNSQLELTNLLNEYIAAENGVALKSGTNRKVPKGFVSIADLDEQNYKTKSSNEPSVEIEEATLEEFNLACAKARLKDPVLFNVFDTTLRIAVADDFYKITDYGTFITKLGCETELYTVIENFEQIKQKLNLSADDSTIVAVSPNVKFFNSFKGSSGSANILATEEDINWTGQDEQILTKATSSWASEYGVTGNFKWEGRNWFYNSVWSKLFGKDITKEARYPSNARMTVELFDVNYIFYASAGVKVKVEKLTKCLWWTYWGDKTANKFAIGFDKFEGEMTYSHPPRKINPLPGDKYNMFSGTFNNLYKEILYRGYHSMDYIKDWSSEILSFVPKDQVTKITDFPADATYKWMKEQVDKNVFDPIKATLQGKIKSKSPMAMYVTWGTKTETITDRIIGVQEYGSGKSKVIRFDRSFGITIGILNGSFSFSSYLPSTFEIKDIDMFGAAFFEGYWRGVRFYK